MSGEVDSERVALFVEQAAVLRSSRAVASIDVTRITMTGDSTGLVAQVDGPDDEATLAYFARVREFDIPGKPLYVPDFFPRLEIDATPRRIDLVAWLREVHVDLGKHPHDWHKAVLGPGQPRDRYGSYGRTRTCSIPTSRSGRHGRGWIRSFKGWRSSSPLSMPLSSFTL